MLKHLVLSLTLAFSVFACAASPADDLGNEDVSAKVGEGSEEVGSAGEAVTSCPPAGVCANASRACKDYQTTPSACQTLWDCCNCNDFYC